MEHHHHHHIHLHILHIKFMMILYNICKIVKENFILYYITITLRNNLEMLNNFRNINKYNIMNSGVNKNKTFERALSSSLSFDEQNEILRNFPSTIKFSYERRTHKKVLSDLYVIIPKGKKYFVWITNRNRKNICFFLEIGYQNKIMNIFYRHVSFDDVLSYGTIFYGTLFRTKNDSSIIKSEIFSVEDIFYYKGDDISNYNYENKLKVIKNIFDTQLRYNISFLNNGVIFGLPYMTTDFMEARDLAEKLPYSIYSIQYRYLKHKTIGDQGSVIEIYYFDNNNNNFNNIDNNNSNNIDNNSNNNSFYNNSNNNNFYNKVISENIIGNTNDIKVTPINENIIINSRQKQQSNDIYKTFFIKPDLQNDIYYLYQLNTTNFEGISKEIAHIPDYKTSVFMNKLFRNIKENNNLDSLEESDDEEEFENIQIDKYVDLNKVLKMRCIFNYKFKKWIPISIV
jgi:hypothetical protein